jgi:hypothetical protein
VKVKVYDIDQTNYNETLRSECDLEECFPIRDAQYYIARAELQKAGRCWCGGGASQMTLLMKVD